MPPVPRARVALLVLAGLSVAAVACSDSSTSPNATPVVAVTPSTNCGTALTLTAGQVVTGVSGTSLCLAGSPSSAEYALIPFNSDTAATAAFTVSATGVSAPSASTDLVAASSVSAVFAPSIGTTGTTFTPMRAFEAGLRIRERATLTPRIAAARAWARSSGSSRAAFDIIPTSVSVGQVLNLNANANVACGSPIYRGGRVVAISDRAIVVADTGNPVGGYTDAEYAAMGATFDTLVDPLDRAAFGDPSDIDGNGHVILFFTKTVNDLTPASNSQSYVGGFFFARDLFPPTAASPADACVGSNKGEMFYVMVPDPARGGAFTKSNVSTEVTATLAHEYQHLINASRRLYVNNANDFEVSWLDEGLAHVAEELLFYRASGLSPRSNISASTLRASATSLAAFNNYATGNFGRYDAYLTNPSGYSPIADNDSLATRGASWSFLRYATDHLASTDGSTWFKLVNSTTTGVANLQNVFGSGVLGEMRDWGVSVLADDISGVSAQYQQQSWNFRNIFATLDNTATFPLTTSSLAAGTKSVNLVRGANAYLRFAVAANGSANIAWPGAPSAVQFSLVRLQ